MKRAFGRLGLIVAASAVATSAILPARGDYLTFDIASHEAMADYTRFESRSWAADAVGEGGRLERNTVWSGDEHVIVSDIYIPSGLTLTINAGTVVKFREGTRIKVEDGGSLVINGASGNEVVLEGYDDETVLTGIVLQSSAASYYDNSFVIVRGFNFGRYATVSLNNTTAFLGGGQALVPVDVSGSRDAAFSFDWVAETNGVTFASGTMSWNRVSDGRKNITVPYPDGLPGCSNFVIRAVTFRCCSPNASECVVTLSEFITTDIFCHEAMADYIAFESREWAVGMEGEGGRLATNATWSGNHTIVSDVYIPSGVTLTLTADTVVEFCEGTRIKIEDGGTLNIVGADGHDVILRGAEGVANFGGIVKMPNGTFVDNTYFRFEGFTYGALANVALHDSSTFRSSGLALIPVTVSGSRSTAFSIDWVAETNGAPYKTGTLKWNGVSEGTKNISINYGAELDGYTNFTLRAAVDRACKTSPNTCTIKISDFIVSDIASHESMADYIAFESREWAADLEGEGGRLAANATWEGTHKIASDVYIPSGVTLTLAADAVVEFYEGTRIKIEDGGTLNIVGANGHDVIIRGAEGVTNYVGIVKMPNGTYTDNMYVQYTDKPYSAYPNITVHEATTYREAGKMWIAFSLSGTTRNQSFNVDWSTDKGDSGTLTWSSSSDGTKWIEIPIAAEPVGGTTNHVITITASRACNISVGEATLTVQEPDYVVKGQVVLAESESDSGDFAINGDIKTQPLFLNSTETIQYSGKWQPYDENEAAVLRVTLETDNGATVLKEASPSETGAFDLNLKQYPVGYYTLKHEILNDLGETLATMQKTFSIADDEDVVLHGGILASNEVWAADKVHVVYETVVVPSIYTIFIEPGAIVKFMTGTGIDISQGGAFFANRIVFTHINDDTVGGDTLNDGFTVAPPMDAYYLAGAFTFGDDTELRGITQNNALTGTIATQKTLSRGSTYRVSGTLTIASGGSLTIPPGTVLKMEDKAAIVVNSGATLNAIGTRASPITFTSIKDDTISGDTNGDGSNTIPQPGDWVKIGINGGTANFEFAKILYSSKNQTTGAINQNGGTVVFCNSEISHGLYDAVGVESGNFYMTNSIITDCLLAFRHWAKEPIVNSVIYDCGRLTQGGGQTFYNCVFSEIAETWEAFGFPKSTYKNCCFWNKNGSVLTGEGTQDALTVCGSDGNIWGDPLFVDPSHGDFRILEGSPCVDTADGSLAPEFDYFGQPRVTLLDATTTNLVGQLADIGICEVMPRDIVSDIDLVPQSVRTVTNAVPGQLLFVKWEIANVGGREVDAAWRDTVSLVSENGREVVLGDKTTSSRIGVGGSVFCSGYFTVPAIAEGTWYPKVNVNSYHDIFEGSLSSNNALTGERAVSVGLEALDPSISREGVINGGTPTVIKLAFGDNDDRMVKFDVPAGVNVTWGFGFMPQGASKSGGSTAAYDGVMFRVPDDATEVYVVLASDTTTAYNLSTESTRMTIASVSPASLPSSGTTTLTITGAGFGETNAVSLVGSVGRVALNAPQQDASGNLIATVDCATLKAGQTYALRVESGDNAADLPGAVTVTKVEGKGHFWYELVLPESGRTGRASAGSVVYGNSGTANMVAPIVDIVSTGDGKISKYPNRDWSLQFRFLAVGGNSNPMVLSPGEEGRMDFYIMTQQRNEFSIYTSDGKQLHTGWPTQTAFEVAMVEAGSRLAWCGEDVSDYEKVFALAKHLRDGEYDNSIGGIVRGSAGEGVENAIVDLYQLSDDSTNKVQTVIASAVGRFVFNGLEDGRYIVGIAGKITETVIVVADGLFVGNANLAVNTGRSITVTPDVLPASDDFVSITFTSCIDPSNVVFPIAIRQGNGYLFDAATDSGFYRVHCVVGNNEGFDGVYVSSNSDVEVSVSVTQPSSISGVVTDLSTYRLPDTDVILSFRGNLSGRTYTVIPDAETGAFEIGEMVGDSYVVTYSGLTCSYEPDMELVFDGERDYHVTFSPVSASKTLTVSYPTTYNNHMLVVAGPEGVLTAEVLDGSGLVEISRVKNGVWSFVVVEESGGQVATTSLELTDENRSCQIMGANMSATMPLMASALRTASARPRLKGIGGWLADKFKTLTHWLGEALANLLPISIMDFFETKEWKEGMDISNQARSYFMSNCKINYPGPCCCGYNDQKYPRDRAAVEAFCKQLNEFSTYVQTCSSMKVVASTSKSIADVADNIGDQVIRSYTGEVLHKMAEAAEIGVAVVAIVDYVNAATELGERYEEAKKEIKKLNDAWDAVKFSLENGGELTEFLGNVAQLTEYIKQWTNGKRNYFSHENKVFAEHLKKLGKALKCLAIVVDAVRDIHQAANDLDQMRHAVDQFPSRKAQFLQQYAYFQLVADNFGHYHEGKECQPEKWPDPEYEPPFDGPYPYPRVVQSYDPNEMVGPLGVGDPETERFVKPGEWMTYTIYFENKTNATAAAQEVYVSQALDANLDWSTFEMTEVAFGDQIDLGLAGKKNGSSDATMTGTNLIVRTSLALDETTGLATWYLRIVDPTTNTGWPKDILAGFLPPNDPETHCGEGHITYRVKVRNDVSAGARIDSAATIVFDYNDPIETDPSWWNTVAQMQAVVIDGEDVADGGATNLDLVVGVPYGELPTPKARAGYTFGGWFTGPNGTGRRVTSESLVEAGDSGLYAHWLTHAYTVRFNANGGEGRMSDQAFEFDKPGALDANAFARRGYRFLGWATNETGAVVYADGAEVLNLTSEDGGAVDLFAAWQLVSMTVTFDPNDGTLGPAPTSAVVTNGFAYGALPTVVREGYSFAGWTNGRDIRSPTVLATTIVTNETDHVLYAQWTANGYTVIYDANGGEGEMEPLDGTYDLVSGLASNAFSRTSYRFLGWATSADGPVVYVDGANVSNLTAAAGSTVTLYAVWELLTVEMAFDAQGGSPAPTNRVYLAEIPYGELPVVSREGYTFGGWYTGPGGTGMRVMAQGIVEFGSDGTLYANWLTNAYTVRFNANGGEGVMSDQAFVFDKPDALDSNAFVCACHDFAGWATAADGESVYVDGEIVVNLASAEGAVIDLFATWMRRIHAVDFYADEAMTRLVESCTVGEGLSVGALPVTPASVDGYSFAGWRDMANPAAMVTADTIVAGDMKVCAVYTANTYTLFFDAAGGAVSTASKSVVFGEEIGRLPHSIRDGYTLDGWYVGDVKLTPTMVYETAGDSTATAHWTKDPDPEPEPEPEPEVVYELYSFVDGAAPVAVASEYNGYLYDEKSGAMKGTIQVKVGKLGKKDGKASVKATVVLGAKKVTLKAKDKGKATIEKDGPTEVELVGGEACEIALGEEGISGTYGAYLIDGSRNFFAAKSGGEAANAALGKWLGVVSVVWEGGSLGVSIAAKGKVKVSGTLASGTKVSAKSTFLVGEEWCAVPVAAPKANLSFTLWLSRDGRTAIVEGLGDGAIAGKPGTLAENAAFRVSKTAALWSSISGTVLADYVPDGFKVASNGGKWVLPKAGKVTYKDGAVDTLKLGENPSGLKLSYKAKDGSFKGSFKVYAVDGGKAKATTVNVTGVMVGATGYGTATIKGMGSVAVTIE